MLRTKSGLPKYWSWNQDQRGNKFVRFRKAGFTTNLSGTPWSEDFMKRYAAALDGVATIAADARKQDIVAGTINALAISYYKSTDFTALKQSTQVMRRNVIESFRADHGDKPVKRLERQHIAHIIGAKAKTPHAANNLLKILRVLLGYAIDIGMINSNPAIGVRKFKAKGDGFHSWSEAEIARYEERHPIGSQARLAMALLLYTAQRRGDVVSMKWNQVRGDLIAVRQEKTNTPLLIPMHPQLARVLALTPRTGEHILTTENGKAFASSASFGNWMRDRCNEASLPQCSAHGLRKAAATRLANAGCSSDQIRAITGHRSVSEVLIYTKAADQQRLARQALAMQLGAESEQPLSSGPIALDKVASK